MHDDRRTDRFAAFDPVRAKLPAPARRVVGLRDVKGAAIGCNSNRARRPRIESHASQIPKFARRFVIEAEYRSVFERRKNLRP
jgi:hypothetical protein